jgi:hypothetical protein
VKQLIPQLYQAIGEATAHGYRIIWDAAWPIALQHLQAISGVLVLILVLSAIEAFTTRRWGWFGSVLYNYLYFGTLILVGFAFGPEIFANDYFKIFLAMLYIVCFLLVRVVLVKTGLKRKF